MAGRPLGATSWWRNLANVAAHHANGLLDLWLAGAPLLEVRVLLLSLADNPEHQALVEECWRARGSDGAGKDQTEALSISRCSCDGIALSSDIASMHPSN
jgi:hypothetical protein